MFAPIPRTLNSQRWTRMGSDMAVNEARQDDVARIVASLGDKGVLLWTENVELRFRAPKGALTPSDRALLHAWRDRIIEYLETSKRRSAAPVLERRAPDARVPLTFSQTARWAGGKFRDRVPLRQVASALRVRGKLHVGALQESIDQLIQRHEALRTRIVVSEGEPVQEVLPMLPFELTTRDLSSVPQATQSKAIQQLIRQVILEPFATDAGPLFTLQLARCGEQDHVLVLALEHMVADGYSLNILWRDLFAFYMRALGAAVPPLPALKVQFADYAVWQRRSNRSWLEEHAEYWRELLACPRLEFERECDPQTHGGRDWGAVPTRIEAGVAIQLREWCRVHHTTLPIAVFTAYVALALRWCEATEAVIRYTGHGRISPEVEDVVGFFAAPLYLHIVLGERDTFVELMQQVLRQYCRAIESADHYYIEAYEPKSPPTRSTYLNWISEQVPLDLAPLRGTPNRLECAQIAFINPLFEVFDVGSDPIILIHERAPEISIDIMAARRAFSEAALQRFARGFHVMIESLLASPENIVRDLALP